MDELNMYRSTVMADVPVGGHLAFVLLVDVLLVEKNKFAFGSPFVRVRQEFLLVNVHLEAKRITVITDKSKINTVLAEICTEEKEEEVSTCIEPSLDQHRQRERERENQCRGRRS